MRQHLIITFVIAFRYSSRHSRQPPGVCSSTRSLTRPRVRFTRPSVYVRLRSSGDLYSSELRDGKWSANGNACGGSS